MRVLARFLSLVLMLVACATPSGPPSTPVPTTLPALTSTTSTLPAVNLTVQGCATPPVAFSVLCEVVGLVEGNHVDPPGPGDLASAAASGVASFRANGQQESPTPTLTCAIPHQEFTIVCDEIHQRVEGERIPLTDLVDAAIESMISLTLDPHSHYLPPQFVGAIDAEGVVAGLGILIASQNNVGSRCVKIGGSCPLTVVSVLPDSPAESAGMLAGDTIVAVDGQPVDQLTVLEAATSLAGRAGTTSNIDLKRGGEPLTVAVVRQQLEYQVVEAEMVADGVGYLRLFEFSIEAQYRFHFQLQALLEAGARTLVFDLRDNPGGLLLSAVVIGSEFLADGLVLKTTSRTEGDLVYPVYEDGIATGNQVRVLVLVNAGSASASEVLAGVLQERGRALVLGQPTYGKNTVQLPFDLRNDGVLWMTTKEWTTPAGASVAGSGLVPDVVVDFPPGLSTAELADLAVSSSR